MLTIRDTSCIFQSILVRANLLAYFSFFEHIIHIKRMCPFKCSRGRLSEYMAWCCHFLSVYVFVCTRHRSISVYEWQGGLSVGEWGGREAWISLLVFSINIKLQKLSADQNRWTTLYHSALRCSYWWVLQLQKVFILMGFTATKGVHIDGLYSYKRCHIDGFYKRVGVDTSEADVTSTMLCSITFQVVNKLPQ